VARSNVTKTGNSKIRFIMLEADLSDGDLSQVTQAIQNALRPNQFSTRLIQSSSKNGHIDPDLGEDIEENFEAEDAVDNPPRKARTSRARSIKPPKVIDGINWDNEPSLKGFVDGFDLKTDTEKYLVVSLWFRDYYATPAISASHMYTAYRHLGWSTAIPDFTKPFRNMIDSQLYTGGSKDGFAINQLGEGKIKAKKRG
jgi:hypothetical protein